MTAEFGVESVDTLRVRDAKDVEEVVRSAIASEQPLEIIGHGTRRQIGHPMATNAVLDLSGLNAVSAYEPNELIITVQAGAPLADVQSLIDSKNQQFAFEPIDTSALLGVSGNGTIGGMIGAGLAGPRRIKAGGARDHLLGAHAVSGFGDVGIGELGKRKFGFHVAAISSIRPRLRMILGSKLWRTRWLKAATPPACGWKTSTFRLTCSDARISAAWPPAASTR